MANIEKITESTLVLEYMLSNGFNPNNSKGILELLQSAPESMSKYLKNYNQYLLSNKVKYNELENYGIKGACGYLDGEGINVPKSLESDAYFYDSPILRIKRIGYKLPSLDEFDTIIFSGLWDRLETPRILQLAKYDDFNRLFGFACDFHDEQLSQKLKIFKLFLETLNDHSNKEFEIVHDTVSRKNKELFLIKEKDKKLTCAKTI